MIRAARRTGGVFSLEKGIDVYRTARGSGWRRQLSVLFHFYPSLSAEALITRPGRPALDEIQIANRMKDIPWIMDLERRSMRLAFWGRPPKEEKDPRRARR